MNEEELKSITEHFKYCIKNNVIRDEEYILMGMEKILNLIEKQQKEIEEKRINYYKVNSKIENTYWKAKIKAKIKGYNDKILELYKKDLWVEPDYTILKLKYENYIEVLKELLGE